MISWKWQMPNDVLQLMTKLGTEDALTLIMAVNAAVEASAKVLDEESERLRFLGSYEDDAFHIDQLAAVVRGLKSGTQT